MNARRSIHRMAIGLLAALCFGSDAEAVEPERQPIYSNTIGGTLCGTSLSNACTVPLGKRLIIEYVSGFVFKPESDDDIVGATMAVKDSRLGLNGNSFHNFVATKTNTSGGTDVFIFSAPLKMMLHPGAQYFFQGVAGLSVSGYLVNEGIVPPPRPTIGPNR